MKPIFGLVADVEYLMYMRLPVDFWVAGFSLPQKTPISCAFCVPPSCISTLSVLHLIA